jgi:hypothetical protein
MHAIASSDRILDTPVRPQIPWSETIPFAGAGAPQSPPAQRPAGFQPGDACPDLLTEEEAIRYLRLDLIDIKNPDETLQRYRKEGHLRGTQISKKVFYLRNELDALLQKLTEINPR